MNKWITSAAAGAVILVLVLEQLAGPSAGLSLLTPLLFWASVCQGLIALAAAAELSGAKWILPIRDRVLLTYPLLLMFPALFLVFCTRLEAFPWHSHPTAWLEPTFFVVRNTVLLAAVAVAAHFFVRRTLAGAPGARALAVLYVFAFVACQSLMAFDWVMSFAYPWINTLFGPYFFIEAFYLGICAAALMLAAAARRDPASFQATLRDTASLLFGFSLLWAGQLFAQYLTIWYGNIPEEVGYVYRRLAESPTREIAPVLLLAFFFIPFGVLVAKAAKRTPAVVGAVAGLVCLGYILERLFFLLPEGPHNSLILLLELAIIGVPVVWAMVPVQRG